MASDAAPDADLLAKISELLDDQPDAATTATQLLQSARDHIQGTEAASLTVRQNRRWTTLATTDDMARRADQWQYDLDEGPCVESAARDEWHLSGDIARDERWPKWAPRASEVGVSSVLCIRLLDNGNPSGALNLYSSEPSQFGTREDLDFALLFATHVGIALRGARKMDQLQMAADARHDVGMAQGILMERFGLDQHRAFDVLRRYSQHGNVKLNQIAADIVESGDLPGALPRES